MHAVSALLFEHNLEVAVANTNDVARVGCINELLAGTGQLRILEVRQEVVAVEVDFVTAPDRPHISLLELLLDVGFTNCGHQGR